jgi:hypothetical protein
MRRVPSLHLLSLTSLTLLLVIAGLFMPTALTSAQGGGQLIGYAALPAGTVTDGNPAGQALAGSGVINGISLPFNSQPFGSVTGIVAGDYPGYWLVLTSGTFQSPDQSADFLLRIYTVETDLRRANGGAGSALPVAWITLSDPRQHLGGGITQAGTRARNLTGADLTPRAFVRLGDGSFWVADAKANQLLRFDGSGKLVAPPSPMGGAVLGLSVMPSNGTLVVAVRGGGIDFTMVDPNNGSVIGQLASYAPSGGSIGGLTMINDSQALVVEHDGGEGNNARFKRVFLVNITDGSKQEVADLLNLDDGQGLSGFGSPFRFPFAEINAVYPIDANTIIVVNNNRVPFGQGRQPGAADSTEYIAVRIGAALNVDPFLLRG